MRRMAVATVVAVLMLSIAGFAFDIAVYANEVTQDEATAIASEAVVFDVNQASLFRMEAATSKADMKLTPASELPVTAKGPDDARWVLTFPRPLELTRRISLTDADRATHLRRLNDIARQIFTEDGPYLQRARGMFPRIVASESPDHLQMDGGIGELRWSDVHVNVLTGTAVLHGRGVAWCAGAGWQGDHYRVVTPTNQMKFTVRLKSVHGHWKVDELERTFASGSEP
ncbi:hypothetical protein GCM10025857_25420 [Alicyclobacillus contaminans]|uniref:hypothetical protein n=1 Tax=Alicyclobacillus contaminans TaxID=392016 RepID=UPI0003FDDCE3|nr:hypothetical protein [Alicyclobacillus contaminans]GMA51185.1 hypothetical protein GCM10025857_25420 [Alicyclobacillus contaminans]